MFEIWENDILFRWYIFVQFPTIYRLADEKNFRDFHRKC